MSPLRAEGYGIILDADGYFWNRYNDRAPEPLPPDKGKEAFDRANDPAHLVFTGLGPAKDQTLIVDETRRDQVFDLLGRTKRIPDEYPMVPCFGYKSSLSGDTTVLLATMEDCPANCDRVFILKLFRDAQGYAYAKHLHPSPGVNKNIATQSGLRLGLTRDQVKAILGWPQHEEEKFLQYGAMYDRVLTRDEVLARGRDASVVGQPAGVYRSIVITFTKDRASGILLYHRVSWD